MLTKRHTTLSLINRNRGQRLLDEDSETDEAELGTEESDKSTEAMGECERGDIPLEPDYCHKPRAWRGTSATADLA